MDRFGSYLGSVLENLVTLLGEVETIGAKRRVISVLVVVVGASKEKVSELTNGPRAVLLTPFPGYSPVGTPSCPYSCFMYVAAMFITFTLTLLNRGGPNL